MENKTNYSQIYARLVKGLSPKVKSIFDRRFGVKSKIPETLESIGDSMDITRERVRQIEEAGFNFVKKNSKEALDNIFSEFAGYFNGYGGFKKEELALEELGGKKHKPYVLFLLTLGEQFSKVSEKKDFHYFWSVLPDAKNKVSHALNSFVLDLKNRGSLILKEEFLAEFSKKYGLPEKTMLSYLEVSKKIKENKEGKIGLTDWPEIKPRGVKDKAFLVFKKHKEPLHFTRVAELIDRSEYNQPNKKTFPQTVHNELIKDPRFVLVGRGTYALKEWGYEPGTIKEVIEKVLKTKIQPASKEEIIKEVMTQRVVAQSTILMNLNNKKYFDKDPAGRYFLRKTETV